MKGIPINPITHFNKILLELMFSAPDFERKKISFFRSSFHLVYQGSTDPYKALPIYHDIA